MESAEFDEITRRLDEHGHSLIVRQVRERVWLAFTWDRRLPVDDLGGPPRMASGVTRLAAVLNLVALLNL